MRPFDWWITAATMLALSEVAGLRGYRYREVFCQLICTFANLMWIRAILGWWHLG